MWTEEAKRIFQLLKNKVSEQLVLVLPYFNKPFHVRSDASGIAIGAVLNQDDRAIAFFSEKLNNAKQKYSSYDKEFYVIVQEPKK